MSVLEIVRQVRQHLEESGRLSYRMLQREFALDDDTLAEVVEQIDPEEWHTILDRFFATYRSQLAERRARVHGAGAHAIEELESGRLGERAALLAYHCEHAGDAREAAKWDRRAAECPRVEELLQRTLQAFSVALFLSQAYEVLQADAKPHSIGVKPPKPESGGETPLARDQVPGDARAVRKRSSSSGTIPFDCRVS